VRCSRCGTTNEAKARFCIECGNRLAAACPSCGSEIQPSAKRARAWLDRLDEALVTNGNRTNATV
jgi:hypothetical protein